MTGGLDRLQWGLAVWVGGVLACVFLPLELLAHYWRRCPWPTASGTIWLAIKDWHPVAYFVAIILFVLWGHFDRHWSVGWLLAAASVMTAAVLFHLATRP